MKLCKDCVFACENPVSTIVSLGPRVITDNATCVHPKAMKVNVSPVTGSETLTRLSCASFRLLDVFTISFSALEEPKEPMECGPDGHFWEPYVG